MAGTKLDSRQSVNRSALSMVGSAANDSLDTILTKVDSELAKLFENFNITIVDGGIIAFPSAGTSVTFSTNLKLHVNSQVAGGAPTVIDLAATTRTLSANLKMIYAVINRTAGTATVTDDSSTLPAQTSANQEVVLIAKRVDSGDGTKRVYFRGGFSLSAGQSARYGTAGYMFASEFAVVDATDTTKKIVMQASGSTTGKTLTLASAITLDRTITFPDATTTVVGTDVTQILSNKQIQYSVSTDSTTTGANTTLASFTSGLVRVTNASLASLSGIPAGASGQSLIIENQTGNTIAINNNEATATAANRIYTGNNSNVSMPNNSTFTFTYDTTAARWMLTSGSGSGSGSGGIDYITNGIAESDTTGWATYADAAGSRPVDGTGGSPSSTFTRSTSSPLRGIGSFVWTKSANNRQGEGFSSDFTIDSADKAKVLSISFDWTVVSGTYSPGTPLPSYTDSDMIVDLYDVTNAILVEPSSIKLDGAVIGTNYSYKSTFQAASNSTSYRLIVHTATTSASAYTLKFDNIVVGPQIVNQGAITTEWVAYTPANGAWTSNTVYSGFWRRVGDSMEIQAQAKVSGTPTSANFTIKIPTGYTIDTSKMLNTITSYQNLGTASIQAGGTSYGGALVGYTDTTTLDVWSLNASSGSTHAYTQVTQAVPNTFINNDWVAIYAKVPIVGWGAVSQLGQDADTRQILASYKLTAATSIPNTGTTIINFDTVSKDTAGLVTTGASWKMTAQTSGSYHVGAQVVLSAVSSGVDSSLQLFKNGSFDSYLQASVQQSVSGDNYILRGSKDIYLNSGDYIDIRVAQNGSGSKNTTTTAGENYVDITKSPGNIAIAASETVNARYKTSAGQSIPNTGASTIVDFATKDWDSHSAVTTGASWKFTAPLSGKYKISVKTTYGSAAWVAGNAAGIRTLKNGSSVNVGAEFLIQTTFTNFIDLLQSSEFNLLAGDYVDVRLDHNRTGGNSSLYSDANYNWIEIERVGN